MPPAQLISQRHNPQVEDGCSVGGSFRVSREIESHDLPLLERPFGGLQKALRLRQEGRERSAAEVLHPKSEQILRPGVRVYRAELRVNDNDAQREYVEHVARVKIRQHRVFPLRIAERLAHAVVVETGRVGAQMTSTGTPCWRSIPRIGICSTEPAEHAI